MTRDRGDCMTRQEKSILHIRKQNRLRRKLILSAIQPLLLVLLLISPLLILGTMELCADPSEPVRATFADCHWERKRLILTTADHRQYMLAHHLRAEFYGDVKDGRVVPGDQLELTWYPWIFQDAVATLSANGRVYGDMQAWQMQKRNDATVLFLLAAILLAGGLAACALLLHWSRDDFVRIRQLKRKYRERLQMEKESGIGKEEIRHAFDEKSHSVSLYTPNLLGKEQRMSIFYYDRTLSAYEESFQWDQALSYLEALYHQQEDARILYSLVGFSWFYAIEGPHESKLHEDDPNRSALGIWKKYLDLGERKASTDPLFLFIAGYTLSLHGFLLGDPYEERGAKLMRSCLALSRDVFLRQLAENFLLNEHTKKYVAVQNGKAICEQLFCGSSLLDRYFWEIYGS